MAQIPARGEAGRSGAEDAPAVLRRYAAGAIDRRAGMRQLGLAPEQYRDFADAMNRLHLSWPRPDPAQIAREAAVLAAVYGERMTTRTRIILPDSGPLFSFAAVTDGLDLLLAPGLPVVLTDYVAWEATRSLSESAQAIRAWIAAHPDMVSVIETELGQFRMARERAGLAPRKERRNVGETTVFEALAEGDLGEGPFLFLFEEDKFVDPGFYGRHPVHSVTTLGFLVGLERSGLIADADAVFAAMRAGGREGVKGVILDRPHRPARDAADTAWRP